MPTSPGSTSLADGQHSDITLELSHAVPNCTSKPLYKQIARGRSKAVFQGKIIVARDAQKTDAKLMMQGLMLSDEAEILSKPELEIYADDVVCGHGSTVGALDEDSMFYLMSRGIPQGRGRDHAGPRLPRRSARPDRGRGAACRARRPSFEGWLVGAN